MDTHDDVATFAGDAFVEFVLGSSAVRDIGPCGYPNMAVRFVSPDMAALLPTLAQYGSAAAGV